MEYLPVVDTHPLEVLPVHLELRDHLLGVCALLSLLEGVAQVPEQLDSLDFLVFGESVAQNSSSDIDASELREALGGRLNVQEPLRG